LPSNWLYVDTNFPSFTGHESVNDKIDVIQNYLYVLLEQLRYCLRNLDTRNMNQVELNKFVTNITNPIYQHLEDTDGNVTDLQVTAKGLTLRIENAEGDINQLAITAKGLAAEISNAQGDITKLQATAKGLAAEISNARGDITSLQATAQGILTRVENAEGSISQFQQTVEGFRFEVTDSGNNTTRLTLTSNGVELASADIQITGEVTFHSLAQSGSTVINGDNITTGTVLSKYIKLMGMLTVYDQDGAPWGVLGHMRGLAQPVPGGPVFSTNGIGFASTAPDLSQVYGMCIATNAGVRMAFGNAEVVVVDGAVELNAGNAKLRVWDDGRVSVNNVLLPGSPGA